MKSNTPVVFDPEDHEKDARLFFVLASNDEEKHLKNLEGLMEYLSDEEFIAKLGEAKTLEEIRALL